MSDLAVEYLPVATLTPYARNARTHSPAPVSQLAGSIREFGWTNPVLIDEAGGIIAGHGRVLAAQQLGMAQVPCIRLAHLTDDQRRAYVLADNKLALNAGWDDELLAAELGALGGETAMDLALIGFSEAEIDGLIGDVACVAMPDMPSGGKAPFQQMSFVLHDMQVGQVKRALELSARMGPYVDSPNANGNGNALARICEAFMAHHALR